MFISKCQGFFVFKQFPSSFTCLSLLIWFNVVARILLYKEGALILSYSRFDFHAEIWKLQSIFFEISMNWPKH